MRSFLCLLIAILSVLSSCSAFEVRGTVKLPRDALTDARVMIDGVRGVGVREDGTFVIRDVPAGSHVLDVHHVDYSFSLVKLDIDENGQISSQLHTANCVLNTAARPVRVAYPLMMAPTDKVTYFVPRESFDPLSLLKQPMILMMVFTMIMVVVMPKMMGNMSPEEKRDLAAMQNSFSVQGLMGKIEAKNEKLAVKDK